MNGMIFMIPLAVLLIAACCWLLHKVASGAERLPVTANWIEELTPEIYGPMLRLLSKKDLEFLQSQPGFSAEMGSRFRAQRYRVFQGYLSRLNRDFNQVSMALKLVLVHSAGDRPELASALMGQQVRFTLLMTVVRGKLLLYRLGFSGVDVTDLVRSFDSMRLELQRLVPAADLSA